MSSIQSNQYSDYDSYTEQLPSVPHGYVPQTHSYSYDYPSYHHHHHTNYQYSPPQFLPENVNYQCPTHQPAFNDNNNSISTSGSEFTTKGDSSAYISPTPSTTAVSIKVDSLEPQSNPCQEKRVVLQSGHTIQQATMATSEHVRDLESICQIAEGKEESLQSRLSCFSSIISAQILRGSLLR